MRVPIFAAFPLKHTPECEGAVAFLQPLGGQLNLIPDYFSILFSVPGQMSLRPVGTFTFSGCPSFFKMASSPWWRFNSKPCYLSIEMTSIEEYVFTVKSPP
jgi:hypothetical protein